ncbi:MAG: nucleotidyltransferase domain-containing protein [Chloroflexi bacterium]|nr:nucleotidyltransferase domain-containing protein [Chloroflexota bacterium]
MKITPHLDLPNGTQIVTRSAILDETGQVVCIAGAVGVVIAAPPDQHSPYLISFSNGAEAWLARVQFSVRKQFQQDGIEQFGRDVLARTSLDEFIIYSCVTGSRAYGLDHEGSDTDRRGIYLPPAELHWSMFALPEQLENEATQQCYWELEKFINLALRANPNILECLYSPLVETATPLAQELLDLRAIFLSQLIYQTYNGYVMSQFKKLEQDLRSRGEIRWKHAMHLIRLLLSGITVLQEGFVPVRVDVHRERLLSIRAGEMNWDDLNVWRLNLHKEFDAAFQGSHLPEQPDYRQANDFLLRARRSMLK